MEKELSNFDKVVTVIAKQLNKKPETIKSEHKIVDDLGADSLDVVELLMSLEDDHGVVIPDEVAPTLTTVGAIVDYLEANIKKK